MKIEFIKISPTENMTILVKSGVDRKLHQKTAQKLMDYNNIYAEQVGYIEKPENNDAEARLQMMGGEFCGNATMSLAVYLAWEKQLSDGSTMQIPLEVSGAGSLLNCTVKRNGSDYRGTVNMPVPEKIEDTIFTMDSKKYNVTVVYMPGITHIIVPVEQIKTDLHDFAANAVHTWNELVTEEAFGILIYNEKKIEITPLVHVKNHSSVWERGCGSGSAALGSAIAFKAGKSTVTNVAQPGGIITVDAKYSGGKITSVSIEGTVKIVATGTAYIDV